MGNKILKGIGMVTLLIVAVPLIKIVIAFFVALFAGLVALVASAPIIMIPIIGGVVVFAVVDYFIVKGLLKLFHK